MKEFTHNKLQQVRLHGVEIIVTTSYNRSVPIKLAPISTESREEVVSGCLWSDWGPRKLVTLRMKRTASRSSLPAHVLNRNNISLVLQFKEKHRTKHDEPDESSQRLLGIPSGSWVQLRVTTRVHVTSRLRDSERLE